MKQYQRNSESELTRMLIDESHQESEEHKLELEKQKEEEEDWAQRKYELSNDFGKDVEYDLVGFVSEIERKYEQGLSEMRKEYENYSTWPREEGELLDDFDDWGNDELFGHDDYEDYDDYTGNDYPEEEPFFEEDFQREEWEKEISWEMRRSDYGCLKTKLKVNAYFNWKHSNKRSKAKENNCEDENYFPKHLEYDIDEFGIPVRSYIEENKNDWFYEEVKVREDLEKENESKLKEMLRERHHLPKNKRIVF